MTYPVLVQGDSTAFMQTLPAGSVDLVLTDPPYGMAFQSNRAKDGPRHRRLEGDDRPDTAWLRDAYKVLHPDHGAIVTFCNWKTSALWFTALEANGFTVKSQVIWDRMHHGTGDLKGAFAPQHDVIWYAVAGRRRVFVNGRPKSVIACKRPSPSQDFGHPTSKPVSLMHALFRAVQCKPVEVVLDPFMGAGSAGVAVQQAGSRFVGVELDPTYYQIACTRVTNWQKVNDQ